MLLSRPAKQNVSERSVISCGNSYYPAHWPDGSKRAKLRGASSSSPITQLPPRSTPLLLAAPPVGFCIEVQIPRSCFDTEDSWACPKANHRKAPVVDDDAVDVPRGRHRATAGLATAASETMRIGVASSCLRRWLLADVDKGIATASLRRGARSPHCVWYVAHGMVPAWV